MDNLTHSLTSALLGRMGLKRSTGRAMPALIIASNLPDIDSFVARAFGAEPIAAHRGFTHGIGGWVTLPLLTVAIILAWDKLRPSKQPVRPLAVLLLAAIATLAHSLLDLFTTYGTRIFEPASHQWFYTGTWFIIDPWVWIALIAGLELSWRAERLGRDWRRPATAACALLLAYVAANVAISARAETLARQELAAAGLEPTLVVASPQPIVSWDRRIQWRTDAIAGSGSFDPVSADALRLEGRARPLNLQLLPPRAAQAPHLRAFLFWSRMPIVVTSGGRWFVTDQRFLDRPVSPKGGPFLIPLD